MAYAQDQTPGPNVNMVSGADWTTGDPPGRQNEPSIASRPAMLHICLGRREMIIAAWTSGTFGNQGQEMRGLGVFNPSTAARHGGVRFCLDTRWIVLLRLGVANTTFSGGFRPMVRAGSQWTTSINGLRSIADRRPE